MRTRRHFSRLDGPVMTSSLPASHRFRRLAAVLIFLVLAGSAHALNFELHEYSFEEDSLTYHGHYFLKDEHTRVAISPPEDWNNVGDAAALTMVAPAPAGSVVRLEKSPLSVGTAFKDKGLELYRQRVLATVPPGATSVHVQEEHDNAFSFFDWHAYEFVVSYDFYGQAFQRSALFVNVDSSEQLMLTAVAPRDGFKKIHDAAIAVLRSWHALSSS